MDSLFDSPNSQYLKGSEVLLVSAAAPMDVDKAAINSVMEKVRLSCHNFSLNSYDQLVACKVTLNRRERHGIITGT